MKIAFVHDYLVQSGGAEKVLETFTEIWPHAPIYTLIHDPDAIQHRFDRKTVRTSFLQKIPFVKKHHHIFPPLMMLATEQFNLDYYDVVLSDSSSFAKNIITRPDTLHISYCHTPMRYAWDGWQHYVREYSFPTIIKTLTPFFMNYIRLWDWQATKGVDYFIANSQFVRRRIKKYYRRSALVINPPVEVEKFSPVSPTEVEDYFLMVGRMIKYKKMDLVIKAFNRLKLPLKVVGQGVEYKRLRRLAGPTIEFIDRRVPEKELARLYARSRAFLFPQEEDFGIVAIEALASGRPVIAYRAGDVEENIEEGKTGIFFEEQTEAEVMRAVKKCLRTDFDQEYIARQAQRFSRERFKREIKDTVEKLWYNFKKETNSKQE